MPIRDSSFRPNRWLAHRHIQTLVGPLLFRTRFHPQVWQEVRLDDGDFCEVAWFNPQQTDQPTLIVLHGLEGSYRSHYVQRLISALIPMRWRIAVIHFRGCGMRDNERSHSYHSGVSSDLAQVLTQIEHSTAQPTYAIGFSLGGNVLLKWLAENVGQSRISRAMSVSAPMRLDVCADAINRGFSRLYQFHLISSLKKKAQKVARQDRPGPKLSASIDWPNTRTFWQFDEEVTAPLNGFNDVHDYYARASSAPLLKQITTPTLILHAKDDPFMDERVIPNPEQLSHSLEFELAEKGGHVGFIENLLSRSGCYISRRMLSYFSAKPAR